MPLYLESSVFLVWQFFHFAHNFPGDGLRGFGVCLSVKLGMCHPHPPTGKWFIDQLANLATRFACLQEIIPPNKKYCSHSSAIHFYHIYFAVISIHMWTI